MPSPVGLGTTLFERDPVTGNYVEWYVVDLVWRDGGVSVLLSRGDQQATTDADRLEDAVTDRDNAAWAPSMYDGTDGDGNAVWIPHPEHTDGSVDRDDVRLRTAPDNPSALTFEKIQGRGSRNEVNNFLEGSADGLVFHELGSVSSWKAAFVARTPAGAIVSALTLHHYHPSTNGEEIAITRVANHTSAPKNTSTWMIARARKWAERTGYERVASYAGVGGNEGVCYRAAGFDADGEPIEVDGKNWSDDHHGSGDGDTSWLKQKYIYELDPETYRQKGREWAVETTTDGVLVPGRSGLSASSRSALAD